jgi:hypothetical protein
MQRCRQPLRKGSVIHCSNTGTYSGSNTGTYSGSNTSTYSGSNTSTYSGSNTSTYSGSNTSTYSSSNTSTYSSSNTSTINLLRQLAAVWRSKLDWFNLLPSGMDVHGKQSVLFPVPQTEIIVC